MLKLKLFGHLMQRTDSLEKTPDDRKDWRQVKGRWRGWQDEMVGWHHWLNGHEFEQALGVGDGQEGLACCSPWDHGVRHDWVTELNWTESFVSLYKLEVVNSWDIIYRLHNLLTLTFPCATSCLSCHNPFSQAFFYSRDKISQHIMLNEWNWSSNM